MRAQPTGSHYINGRFHDSPNGAELVSIFPATGEVIAKLNAADDETIELAMSMAESGQKIWAATPPLERGRVLQKAAAILREKNRELSVLETLDTGKPLQETLVADAASGADCLEYFGNLAGSLTGEHIDLGGSFAYTKREPLGVCVGIGAWNYPVQIACWKAAPALACGNAMVFKPSEVTPLTALRLAEALTEAGLPAGVFNVVQGFGDVGAKLIAHPKTAKVSLTGSVPTGSKVAALAGEHLKKITLELGGKSPLIVFEDADIENAVSAAINANFYSSGQICSNGTRVFVHSSIKQAFLKRLVERTGNAVLGDPLNEETNIGPLVSKPQLEKVLSYMRIGQDEGARLVCGGGAAEVATLHGGYFVQPTVFADVTDQMRIAREEIFGPVMSVLDFETEDEVLARANATEFGLAAGVFTKDIQRAHRVIDSLQAGTCWINTYNLTPIEMPFGGYKKSGVGRENGHAAIEYYSQIKSVYVEMNGVEAPF
ncbi:betaine aldehyde dehydrogenase [Roseibium hamelinense]|uniref:Betaine aldehyde dehydrogenase n=1 Tax=Roseibium hamelinense TaxID=150831 RepID=A0A562T3D2_9HYPH|nr:betaine-aldehyde dehydrogenase [Roseibium hamelinense]MTI44508.1 betaine-aldehyde dehydrogenase [Roseibium hamelinense]TWI87476.1 betaine aldehyde dehydrogenase [Roseibium hamelinense]